MVQGQLFLEPEDVGVQSALSRGAALLDACSASAPVALYMTGLSGDALVLGRHQLASQALARAGVSALRRATGGTAVRAGAGVLYVALALADRSSLMSCPPGRLLNRNVRGMLAGLRLTGAKANYFGRDFLSFGAPPAVYAGWDALEHPHAGSGTVLLEFFLSHTRSCFVSESELTYPARQEPALRGQTPTTLQEAGVSMSLPELFEQLAQGHARTYEMSWQTGNAASITPHPDEPPPAADSADARMLVWSSPREEAIGFVSAGLSLDGAGKVAAIRVAGDFFAHRGCMATLERVLLGVSPTADHVGRAVDAAFSHAGYDVEGIRSLRTFQDAIIDAAAAAASVLSDPAER